MRGDIMDKMMMERRKFMRFDIPLHLEFKASHNEGDITGGVMINFSREGFCFQSELSDFISDRGIDFNIKLPDKKENIPVRGDVVWVEKNEGGSLAGVRIHEIGNEEKFEILDFAYDRWLETMKG